MWGSRKFLLKVEDLAKERRPVWKVFEPRQQGPGTTRARVVQSVILNGWPEKREVAGGEARGEPWAWSGAFKIKQKQISN